MAKKATNILIIGAEKPGMALIELFHNSERINIIGVVDKDTGAPGMQLAKKLKIPASTDYKDFINKEELHKIADVTGDPKVRDELLKTVPSTVEIISGHSSEVIWNLIIEEYDRAEEAVELAYRQLNQIFQNAADGMCVIDKNFKMLKCNRTFLDLLSVEEEETIDRECYNVFPDFFCDTIRDAMDRIAGGEERVERDVMIERKGGIRVPCILTATPFRGADNKPVGIIASFKDITERKSAERALLENIKLKSNFTSVVSHELRTPLTAIKEGISIVLEGLAGEINEEQEDFLDTAKRNVDRLARLINDVLDFTKLRSERMVIKATKGDINKAVEEVIKVHGPLVKTRGLYLKTDLDQAMPIIQFDTDRITQVLSNLVDNALKFTHKGGVTVSTGKKKEEIHVCVKDTGPGIEEEDLAKLFREFQQVEDAKSRTTGGTGLGLAICREIIEQHGGRIWVESEPGKGSQFQFTLPLERKYKILIVDDDENFLKFSGKFLSKNGYDVLQAETGAKGLDAALNDRPDLIVLDMKLPDANGYEIIGRLRSDEVSEKIPVLAVSGYAGELEELEHLKGTNGKMTIPKLMKPFENEELLQMIKTLLRKGDLE